MPFRASALCCAAAWETDGRSGRVTCVTSFPFSVSVQKHIKAALIGPLNHQSTTHSSTMRMSGLTSISALLVVYALAGSIDLAEVSMIQKLINLAFITYRSRGKFVDLWQSKVALCGVYKLSSGSVFNACSLSIFRPKTGVIGQI